MMDKTLDESHQLDHMSTDNFEEISQRKRRLICNGCKRPTPKACVCRALPLSPVILSKCCVIALVHPLELERKNRSLPLIELCIGDSYHSIAQGAHNETTGSYPPNFSLCIQVGRKFEKNMDPFIMSLLYRPDQDVLLLFPCPNAISLEEALDLIRQRRMHRKLKEINHSNDDHGHQRIILIFLDATWKLAKEMAHTCSVHNVWPDHVIRVRIETPDFLLNATNSCKSHPLIDYQPKRFHIRTPPSENHLSTAESIAMVVSRIEENYALYDTFMKPLDLMVKQWHGDNNINF